MKFFTAISVLAGTAAAAPAGTETTITKRAQLCSNFNGFADNSTSMSPLVSDCRRILDRTPSVVRPNPFVWDVPADPRWINLFSYRDCMFGVRAKTVDVQFNEDDSEHLAKAILDTKAPTDRIEGTGVVTCGAGELEWAFYKTRASEWR